MSESCVNFLLNKIHSQIQRKDTLLRSAIPAITKLQAVLYFLATGCSLRTLTHIFRLGKSTISEFIIEVCAAIYESLTEFIKIPTTTDWKIIENGFRNQWHFPGCCGAIDGKHVVIKAPPESGSLYYNYKETNSIVLMAVVDHKYCFSYIDVGCTGRVSDGGVFRNCSLYQELENGILPEDHVLVGDNAFPLKEYLLKPFPGNRLTSQQKIFNYRLSRARRIVENAFGILAARFRVFEKPMPYSPEKVVKIVKTCCALHNWLRQTELQNKQYEYTVDKENYEAGTIVPGNWRNEPESLGMQPLPISLSNRSSQRSIDRRERYANYFVGSGSVSWQTRMIH
ncbi:putative nuclease HARBI1 [Maniola jurtina]|nr:putative nuclease HARBI1 isoform X2 [Maniola jurtina]XP_045785920.1 putative nuclease HARBI1 [Maniola jurtina]